MNTSKNKDIHSFDSFYKHFNNRAPIPLFSESDRFWFAWLHGDTDIMMVICHEIYELAENINTEVEPQNQMYVEPSFLMFYIYDKDADRMFLFYEARVAQKRYSDNKAEVGATVVERCSVKEVRLVASDRHQGSDIEIISEGGAFFEHLGIKQEEWPKQSIVHNFEDFDDAIAYSTEFGGDDHKPTVTPDLVKHLIQRKSAIYGTG